MEHTPLALLFTLLVMLVLVSAFFSGSETGMMAANRYRMRHKMREGQRGAKRVVALLTRPDRLLGVILIGNTFANIFAASIATIIGVRLLGDIGIWLSTLVLTFIVLVFAEVTPKTLAAFYPERFAETISWPMVWLLRLFYPLVVIVNLISNGFLALFGISAQNSNRESLTQEELRSLVVENSRDIPRDNQSMLIRLLDLQEVNVEDIMVPRHEIIGIDIAGSWQHVLDTIENSQHTRLPIYSDNIDSLTGVVHTRNLLAIINRDHFDKTSLLHRQDEAYFVPIGTPLTVQLFNFQENKTRTGFVVDEYGDIQGLVTLEDILEEIVGEFTTDVAANSPDITPEKNGTFLVDGTATLRDLNRAMQWDFATDGPKTMSGLIIEYLEMIPEPGTSCRISGYPIEILQIKDNKIKTVRIMPEKRCLPKHRD